MNPDQRLLLSGQPFHKRKKSKLSHWRQSGGLWIVVKGLTGACCFFSHQYGGTLAS
jgi:hypothetical protein